METAQPVDVRKARRAFFTPLSTWAVARRVTPTRPPKYQLALYTVLGIIVLLNLILFPKWVIDDAYIIFRYADNFAQHGQLTFNVGEDPVEGYTGVLLSLAIAFALRLGMNPVVAAHVIGVGSYTLSLIFFDRLLRRLWGMGSPRIAWLLLLATAPFLYTHAYSGLETMLFTAILLCASLQLHYVLSSTSASLRPHALLAVLLLLLALCRPEGAVYAVVTPLLVTAVLAARRRSWLPAIVYASVLAAPGLVYFLWRWKYYGFLLPNTYYVKLSYTVTRGTVTTLKEFGGDYLLLPALGVVVTCIAWRAGARAPLVKVPGAYARRPSLLTAGSLLLFTGAVLAVYMRSTLSMNFSYRFYAPLYPVALLLLAGVWLPAFHAVRLCSKSRPLSRLIVLVALSAGLIIQTGFQIQLLVLNEVPFAAGYMTGVAEPLRAAGQYLKRRMPGREWLVVFCEAGAIPFYSGLRTVDFGEYNDKYLSHKRFGPLKDRVNYFFAKNPGALAFTSTVWRRVKYGAGRDDGREADAITHDPRFENYTLVRKFGGFTVAATFVQFVFVRKDLQVAGREDGDRGAKEMVGRACQSRSKGR